MILNTYNQSTNHGIVVTEPLTANSEIQKTRELVKSRCDTYPKG